MVDYEVEDFDLQPAEYQTMLHVFDEKGECFGTQLCATHEDPEEAMAFAKMKAEQMRGVLNVCVYNWDGKEISGAAVTLETVIKVDGEEELAGTLFNETVYVKLG